MSLAPLGCQDRKAPLGLLGHRGRRASREPLALRACRAPKDFKGQREIPDPPGRQGPRASREPLALRACRVSKDPKGQREIPAPPDRRAQRATLGPEALPGRKVSKAMSALPD